MFNFLGNNIESPDWKKNRQGSARWTEDHSNFSALLSGKLGYNTIPLGVNKPGGCIGPMWNTQELEGHGLCFAPNGTGKGTSVIIPALLTYAGSMLVIDPKGENAWITAERRRRLGQRVVVLDPWNEVNRFGKANGVVERATRFNPLSFIRRVEEPITNPPRLNPNFSEDVAALAEALIITEARSNPHFPDAAREFVGGLIALSKEAFGHRANLKTVRDLITGPGERWAALVKEVQRQYKLKGWDTPLSAKKLTRFMGNNGEEAKGVQGTAIVQTGFLDSPLLQESMMDDSHIFDMDTFPNTPTTIYVVLPADKLDTHARWLRMIISLALRAITRCQNRLSIPCMLLIDEMGTIGALRPLERAYGLLRGYNVRLFGFFQSLPQLQHDYPGWSNFINNCSVIQVLAAKDETAEHFSRMLGSHTITDRRISLQNPFEKRYSSRPLIYPHEIAEKLGRSPKRLWENTQLVIKMQGHHNILTLQNPYFRQAGWRGLYRPPPNFSDTERSA